MKLLAGSEALLVVLEGASACGCVSAASRLAAEVENREEDAAQQAVLRATAQHDDVSCWCRQQLYRVWPCLPHLRQEARRAWPGPAGPLHAENRAEIIWN
jgi:hypothetical protein